MPYGADHVHMTTVNEAHLYESDGKCYPSVTTILQCVSYSPALMRWANSLGFQNIRYDAELNRTAQQGTFVHEMNQCLVDPEHGQMPKIKDPLIDYRCRKRHANFRDKLEYHHGHWKTVFAETPFASHTYEIAGTMDWVAEWYDRLTLFDFKTSSALRDKHILQLGGYRLILADNGFDIRQGGIILCQEMSCSFNMFPVEILDECANIFLDIYAFFKRHDVASKLLAQATIL